MFKVWCIFLGLVVAAFFVPSVASAPAAKAATCPSVLVVGLHGVGEGPSPTVPAKSATIEDTFKAVLSDVKHAGQSGWSVDDVDYQTVPASDFSSPAGVKAVLDVVYKNAVHLEKYLLEPITSVCPGTEIDLVGYSLGAWIINYMLTTFNTEWSHIGAAVFYGDPCWYNSSGGYTGMAQYAAGCIPESTYPDPISSRSSPFQVLSVCNYHDPICGQGYPPTTIGIIQQYLGAKACEHAPPGPTSSCTHYDYTYGYPKSGSTVNGASFLFNNT